MPSGVCHKTLLMVSQRWFKQWLGAVRQQAISRANIDSGLCLLMTSRGHNWWICCRRLISIASPSHARMGSDGIHLTHWGRVAHICVVKMTIIRSDNGLSPGRRQAIIWTNAGILLIGPRGTNFSEMLIGIQTFLFKKCIWKCRLRNGVYLVSASMC